MCGILGWFSTKAAPPDKMNFQRALLTMRSRGPDDTGFFESETAMFGHVRLSIIDPVGGHQPMVDQETGVAITFNGELYNYVAERQTLEQKKHRFVSRSDTEVLLRMYIEYGQNLLDRTNGMFAFAVFDPRENILFCGRDHAGIKPFYYCTQGDSFFFASEIKGLVQLCGGFEPNPRAISDYIQLQLVMGEENFFKNVYRLAPGESMTVRYDGSIRREKWYRGAEPQAPFEGDFDQAVERFADIFKNAVSIQLRSDVPLGAHLSGGLDTGSICAVAARSQAPGSLATFTAGFKEGGVFDDTQAAATSARYVNAENFVAYPDAKDFADVYPKLAWHLDEPMAAEGVFPQYIVSKLAKTRVKVVLGGQGADEILGGYTRHYLLLLNQAISNGAMKGDVNLGIGLDELGDSLGQIRNYEPLWRKMQAGGMFDDPADVFWRMIDRSGSMGNYLSNEFINSLENYSPYDTFRRYFNRFPEAELLNRALYFETSCLLPALLHIEDRMSMAVSLESRVPICDPELIRFAFSLPTRIKMKNGVTKAVLRKALSNYLSPQIRDRIDKLGFPAPTNRWFAGPLKDFVRDTLLSKQSLQGGVFRPEALRSAVDRRHPDFDRDLWGMLNIALWFRNLTPCQAP